MKKHLRKHKKYIRKASQKPSETYMVVVRSWMLVVVFALMLGIGFIVGDFLKQQLESSNPQVAGAAVEAR